MNKRLTAQAGRHQGVDKKVNRLSTFRHIAGMELKFG